MQGPVLMQFPQLADDSIAVIWTMVERHDTDSQWAPFWQSLPQTLHSGLSMSENLLQTLQGTSAYAECTGARQVWPEAGRMYMSAVMVLLICITMGALPF